MGHSQRLRLREIRQVFQLLGEVGEMGGDPEVWRRHALKRLCEFTGARVGMTVDMADVLPGKRPYPIAFLEIGFDEAQSRRLGEYYSSDEISEDPGTQALISAHQARRLVTRTRHEMVDSARWYASPAVSEARKMGQVDHFVCTTVGIGPPGLIEGFILYRDWGAAPFEDRHRKQLRLFHAELLKRMQLPGALSPFELPPALEQLPPHLRATLWSILKGQSAKEAAGVTGRSYHTIRSYTKELYERLKMGSREELVESILKGPHGRVVLPMWAVRQ